jgi:hypothetical protein
VDARFPQPSRRKKLRVHVEGKSGSAPRALVCSVIRMVIYRAEGRFPHMTPEQITTLLESLANAETLADVNIAAGIALNELHDDTDD